MKPCLRLKTMTENNDTQNDRQHSKDVFEIGDRIPWYDAYAVVVERQVMEEVPDDMEEVNMPSEYSDVEREDDLNYVVLTLDLPAKDEKDEGLTTATWLYDNLDTRFNKSGLPSVKYDQGRGVGVSGGIDVQTPATGGNDLTPKEAEELASFLREHKDFSPLWKLLGRTDSARDMEDIADALNRAVTAERLSNRAEE